MVWTYRAIAVVLGALQAWAFRFEATPDGVSYLDVADAYREGRWASAPNGYWSPLYSWLLAVFGAVLRLPPQYDFVLIHIVNVAAYVAALVAFEYLLRGIEGQTGSASETSNERRRDWWSLGYALFVWSTLGLIGLGVTTPDVLLAAAAFTVAGILTRARAPGSHLLHGVLLGVAAGVGYLAKAAFIPVSIVLLGVAVILWWRSPHRVLPAVLAVLCFAVVTVPYGAALSRSKGRVTFGDQGRIAYAWIINGVPGQVHWQGGPASAGAPVHTTRQISSAPDAYEFSSPLVGTYPPWYDPSYWYEGVKVRWDPATQLRIVYRYVPLLLALFAPLLLIAVATLVAVRDSVGVGRSDVQRGWWLVVPGAIAIAMYACLFLETRYIAPFVVMVWIGTLLILERVLAESWRRGFFVGAAAVLLAMTLPTLTPRARALLPGYANTHWDDALFVRHSGVRPGDRIAILGDGLYAYWARLARVRIIAEVPARSAAEVWNVDALRREEVLQRLAKAGATAVVAQGSPPPPGTPAWQIGRDGRLAVLRLPSPERD